MLHSIENTFRYTVHATDGDVGTVHDVYFDDRNGIVRYFVVDTGLWLFGRKVLLSPVAIEAARWDEDELLVALTQEQVQGSPEIDLEKPVSRQMEEQLYTYYGWAPYWHVGVPPAVAADIHAATEAEQRREADPHLRSAREVLGYHIEARDGEIGHLQDLYLEPGPWIIRYALVDTRNWLPGRHVLVAAQWIDAIDWGEARVHIDLAQEQIEAAPQLDPERGLDRQQEVQLWDHYGLPPYWTRPTT